MKIRENKIEKNLSPRELRDQKIRAESITRILNGAEKVFAKKGYDGARMSDLAEAAGLPKANLYYYFGTKDVIYQTVIEELLSRWDESLDVISADKEPKEAITQYIRAKILYSQQHPAASKLFAKEIISGSQFFSAERGKALRTITKKKVQVIEIWIKEGKMSDINPYHFFFLLWSTTQYYADFDKHIENVMKLPRLNDSVYEDAIEFVTTTVLTGCGIH
ncbi:MAG: TetR/AcrR family transcriptional regulator [Halioglobus sp.]|jgi:TetR/AcrR family transcriptional regulator